MCEKIFEKNLKSMEKWYSSFADLIREKDDFQDDTEVYSECSWDGEKIFRIKKEGRSLYLGGKRNAKEPITMWLERLGEISKHASVFLFGIGSGAYLKALADHTKEEVNIVVYEPSMHIFLKTLQEIDLSKVIESRPIAFIVEGLNAEEFKPVVEQLVVWENLEFVKEEIHPNYKEWYGEKITEYMRILQRRVEFWIVNFNTGNKFSTHIAANVLRNMKYVYEGYHPKKLMEVISTDVPAILVSAGPSLNKNLKDLKKAKNRAFILAVDTALKPLMREGIRPDAFVTIDAKKPYDLIDAEGVEDIPIVAPSCAHHVIVEHQKGKKIFYNDGEVISSCMYVMAGEEFPAIATGGSVACNAFSLLYKMGFKTIILVGQDLAYSDNRSHADGTFQEKMPEEDTKGMITVKGNYVDRIPSRYDFRIYLDWFEMYIKGAKEHENIRVINATEGGAYIEGTEINTLRKAIEENCRKEVCFEEEIEKMESAFSAEARQKAAEYLHSIPEEYEKIRKTAVILEKTYKKLNKISRSGNGDKENILKILKKIKKLTKKCQEAEAYQLIDMTLATADYLVRGEYFYEREDAEKEIQEIARKGVLYSQILQECAELLKEMAEEVLLPIT